MLATGNSKAAPWVAWIRTGLPVAGLICVVVALSGALRVASLGFQGDAYVYWSTSSIEPYANSTAATGGAYLYSPAFLQAIEPLRAMPWTAFYMVWAVILTLALIYLVGPFLAAPLMWIDMIDGRWAPVWSEVATGNVAILLVLAMVVGLRHPAAWSFVLLTKVTPGIGLLWFVTRREWRSLGIALGATAAIAAGSAVFGPSHWADWLGSLTQNASMGVPIISITVVPFWVRFPIAAAMVILAARRDWPWVIPIAGMVALPYIVYTSPTMLAGVLALWRRRSDEPVVSDRVATQDQRSVPQVARS